MVDSGAWTIDDKNMDLSVKPGDNFFMYCNGSWWKNTVVPTDPANPENEDTGFFVDVESSFSKQCEKLSNATIATLESHIKNIDNTASVNSAVAAYEKMKKKVLLECG